MKKKYFLLFLFILSLSAAPVFAEEIEIGWISGQMMIKDGGAMAKGMVVFFRADEGPVPDPNRYLRIPDEVADLDEEGKFRVALPVGKYFMGAIKRMSGEKIGPPQDGDFFFISRDADGKPLTYAIEKDKDLSTGVLSEAVPFKRTIAEDATGISGLITDMKGNPVEGAIVFAYFTETMTGMPPFASYRTGADGKYFISVSHKGTYYLRVRDIYGGGPPVPGAMMGSYGEEKPAPVTVNTGEIKKGINITVIRHLERGPKAEMPETGVNKSIQQQIKKQTEDAVKKDKE